VAFDETEIRGALLNLVDNAVKATEDGGAIGIAAVLDEECSELRVVVEDSGKGIAEKDRASVLDRFARPGSGSAGGTGLGLAIVRAVAEGHGGRVQIDTSPLGGARVIMTIKAESVYDPGDRTCTS
ncbi:MAG TPA: ATP-binding protein, partial [Acidimicrobiales bacterium]|nr:ATP-binding protein [Acidimicrobiales bacterium]